MTTLPRYPLGNLLLAALPAEAAESIIAVGDRVDLKEGDTIATAGERIEHVCFPEAGVASYTDRLADGTRLEIGLIGREGCTGWPLLLGSDRSAHQAQVQIGQGTAIRIDAAQFVRVCEIHPEARNAMLRFVHSFIAQMGRTIVSNLIDPTQRRLARWILMCHDRSGGDEIPLTHKYMAVMLGVRRASVTDAVHMLEGEGAISGRRGLLIVRDRERLEELAGETYGPAEAEYRYLISSDFGGGRSAGALTRTASRG